MKDRKLLNIELGRISAEQYKAAAPSGVEVILDNVRSAHNVGSVFRSADAFRVDHIWLCGITALPPSAEIHKTALGAEESVEWTHREDTAALIRELQKDGFTVVAVEQTEHSVSLRDFKCDFGKKYAFVFGNEVDGVSQEAVDACDFSLEIPQYGTKHSLNVSVCAGVVLWVATDKQYNLSHMKLLKLFIPALAILAFAQGCTKEYITNYNGAKVYARDFTVKPTDWLRNQGANEPGFDNYLYADFDNPDITQNAVDNGTVQAFIYVIYDVANNLGSWNPLPFLYPLEIKTVEDGNETIVIAPENTRFEYNVGKVTFIIQDLDGFDPEDITNSMSIKVCVTI